MSTVVYRIFGENRALLYVGVTDNYDLRMRSHSEKAWWREVRQIETQEFAERGAALSAEAHAIRSECPKYNIIGTGGRPARVVIPRANDAGKKQLVTLNDAAAYLGCATRTIRRRIGEGAITAYRFGPRSIRVDIRELDGLLRPIPNARGELS